MVPGEQESDYEACLEAERDVIAIMDAFYRWLSEFDGDPGAFVDGFNGFMARIDDAVGPHPIGNPLDEVIVDRGAIPDELPRIRGLARRILLERRNG